MSGDFLEFLEEVFQGELQGILKGSKNLLDLD